MTCLLANYASKFAIFLEYINPRTQLLFHFSFCATTLFFPYNDFPGLCQHRTGHSLEGKNKVKWNEKQKLNGFCILKIWQILKHFARSLLISPSINLLFLNSVMHSGLKSEKSKVWGCCRTGFFNFCVNNLLSLNLKFG